MWLGPAILVLWSVYQRQFSPIRYERVLCVGLQDGHAVVALIKRSQPFPADAVIQGDFPIYDELILYIVSLVQFQPGGACIHRQRVRVYAHGAVSKKERC